MSNQNYSIFKLNGENVSTKTLKDLEEKLFQSKSHVFENTRKQFEDIGEFKEISSADIKVEFRGNSIKLYYELTEEELQRLQIRKKLELSCE